MLRQTSERRFAYGERHSSQDCGRRTKSEMGMNVMWATSEIFLLWVIIVFFISLLYLLPAESPIRGRLLNRQALVMFNMLILSTSRGFARYRPPSPLTRVNSVQALRFTDQLCFSSLGQYFDRSSLSLKLSSFSPSQS